MEKKTLSTKKIIIIIAAVVLIAFVATMLGLFIPRSIFVAVPELENLKVSDVSSIHIDTVERSYEIIDKTKIDGMLTELLGYKVIVATGKPKNDEVVDIKINKKDGSIVQLTLIGQYKKGHGGFIKGTNYRMWSGYVIFDFPETPVFE